MKKIVICFALILLVIFGKNQLNSKNVTDETTCAKMQSQASEIDCQEYDEEKTCSYLEQNLVLAQNSKSAYICDENGKVEIYAKNPDERLTIASMTKIMLLNLVFQAIDDGNLKLDEKICVSERASSMGGSQVFLQANKEYLASDLIKSVIIASANDASVALSERLFSSEENCVDKMNALSREWGLNNTLFSNVTGLPKPNQYSCAKDVSVMLSKLIKHDKYFDFSSIYLDELIHPDGQKTLLTNTNKLVKFYNGCDGGKTGYTSESKYCISATAKKGDMRVIAVVIGEPTSKERFSDIRQMFDFAFNNYQNRRYVDKTAILSSDIKVSNGNKKTVSVSAKENYDFFCKKGEKSDLTYQLNAPKSLQAPITKGQTVGEVIIYNGGVEICRLEVVSCEDILRKTLFDSLKDIFSHYKLHR